MAYQFKLQPHPDFQLTAAIPIPGQNKTEDLQLTVKFLTASEFENQQSDVDFFKTVVKGWGIELPFTPENVDGFLDYFPGAAFAVAQAYAKASRFVIEKN